MSSPSGQAPGEEPLRPDLHVRVTGDGHAYVAGRDQHFTYHDGTHHRQRTQPTGRPADECPYPGLAAFEPEQARWFFGREQAVADLATRLDHRLGAGGPQMVVAPSGAGKSSLLRAGLLPYLADGGLPGSATWPVLVLTPTADPLTALAAQICARTGGDPGQLAAALAADPRQVVAPLHRLLDRRHERDGTGRQDGQRPDATRRVVVVVVDQFEELFTLCPDESRRQAFIQALTYVTTSGSPSAARMAGVEPVALVVAGLRADFYPACLTHPELRAALADRPLLLGAMTTRQVREAILYPARAAGLDIEPGLVELLLRDLGVRDPTPADPTPADPTPADLAPAPARHPGPAADPEEEAADAPARLGEYETGGYEPGRLPLLAHALRTTWQQRDGTTLTVQGYRNTGTIDRAIATTADHVYTALPHAAKKATRPLFLRLIKIGDGTQDTRRRIPHTDLLDAATDRAVTKAAMDAFTAARLLTQDDGAVQITHETLLRGWPLLRRWIDDDRTGRLLHQDLEETAATWTRTGRDNALLYRGSRLEAARTWADARPHHTRDELSPAARTFLTASTAAQRTTRRARTATVAALAVLAVLACVAAAAAVQKGFEAVRQQGEALRQRDLAVYHRVVAEAERLPGTDTSLSAHLHLLAEGMRHTDDGYTRLLTTQNTALSTTLSTQRGNVSTVTFTRDGRTLATANWDRSIRLWNLADPALPVPLGRPLTGFPGPVYSAAFRPDGRLLAGSDAAGTVRLWDVADPANPVLMHSSVEDDVTTSVTFSPDGRVLAGANMNGTIRFWNVTAPARPQRLARVATEDSAGIVMSLAYSPDGHLVAAGSTDGGIRLWDVTDPARPVRQEPAGIRHDDMVTGVAFHPDSRRHILASAGADRVARLWDVRDPARPKPLGAPLAGHTGALISVAFTADGTVLASAGEDRAIRLWNIADPARPVPLGIPLAGHTAGVISAAFSPDGRTLASGGKDGSVRLWDLPRRLSGHTGAVRTVAYRPGGDVLASGGEDGTVRLWQVSDPGRPAPLGGPLRARLAAINAVAFSPDGRTLAAAGDNGRIGLWDVTDAARPLLVREPVPAHRDYATIVAFRPSGHILASGGADGAIRLWDATDPAHLVPVGKPIAAFSQSVTAVAFSPDGRTLAGAAAHVQPFRLWDVSDPAAPRATGKVQPLHRDTVAVLAFAPAGRILASAGYDQLIQLWDVSVPGRATPLGDPLAGHADLVPSVAFTPDGRTLASAGWDRSVRLWDVSRPARPLPRGGRLTGPTEPVTAAAFSPDGHTVAAAGDDRTIWLWNTDVTAAVRRICAAARGALPPPHWRRYVGENIPFKPPCG